MNKCEQVCPYNTLYGCKVKEYNQICPLANTKAKAEAVKEFAELLKSDWIGNMYYCEDLDIIDWIDNLVKEMVGEG